MDRPDKNEYPCWEKDHIQLVPDGDVIDFLKDQQKRTVQFFGNISPHKEEYRYAPDKWSLREVIGHCLDAERIFAYRALRFSRRDSNPLPGFDENEYVKQSGYNSIPLKHLKDEFNALRESNIFLFSGFTDEMLLRRGKASDYTISVRAIIYITAGHLEHHLNIIKERYLKAE